MASVNKVMILGNLGRDPELRHTQAGKAVATLRVATNEAWTDQSGERQERTAHGVSSSVDSHDP